MVDLPTLAASLSEAQRSAVFDAVTLLDHFAGEGMGMDRDDQPLLWADDTVVRLADAFGIKPDGELLPTLRAFLEG